MSELRFETLTLPAADLGPCNPLPALARQPDVHAVPVMDPAIPPEDARYVGYGVVGGCLPYRVQDGYDRKRRPRRFHVAVLENEILRATFLLERGGRMISLFHKPRRRELLDRNPVFQPANLAIRNAWFSGGVEWNIGLVGHCPFTCDPLFAAQVEGPGGVPVLRLYEWERIRGVPFHIDAWLPDESPVLFVHVRIRNPNDRVVPMYWWSNIAVPETPDTRVVVPADHAYRFAYNGGLLRAPFPLYEGIDRSYSTRSPHSTDFFFRIPDGHRPWIAALDATGRGLIHTSTARLKGRKLFLWGNSAGGRRWQEFLSVPGQGYIEIQAGLARTQAEHLPMPPRSDWSWLEAYGLMETDPALVHGTDWSRAWQSVDRELALRVPEAVLEAEYRRAATCEDIPPAAVMQAGSGWGALEQARRRRAGEPSFDMPGLVFEGASDGPEQRPWLELLRKRALPKPSPDAEPSSWMVQPEWHALLENALAEGRGSHWFSWLHAGVMRYRAGDLAGARAAWEQSYRLTPSPWAARNLAVVSRDQQRIPEAVDWIVAALLARPGEQALAVECGRILLDADRPADWLSLMRLLPAAVRRHGRIRLMEGQAALAAGDLKRVQKVLDGKPVVVELREGERALSDLWFGLQEQLISRREHVPVDEVLRARVRRECPPPAEFDFRMQG